MVLARRVAQSGVRLLLVRGSADPAFRACCAEQAVLCLTGTTSQDLPSSAGATVTRNQLIGLPRAQTVQLQGRLVVCGARRGSTRRRACHLAAWAAAFTQPSRLHRGYSCTVTLTEKNKRVEMLICETSLQADSYIACAVSCTYIQLCIAFRTPVSACVGLRGSVQKLSSKFPFGTHGRL